MPDPRETRRPERDTPSGSTPQARPDEPGSTRPFLVMVVIASTVLTTWGARLWAERGLDHGEPVPLAGGLFRLTLGENTGVAFGLLGGSPLVPWLAVLALALFSLALARSLSGSRAGAAALGLILGGGVANLLDRIGDRGVTDYLDLGVGAWRWPTFNLPDVAITAGFLLVVWVLARGEQAEEDAATGPAASRSVPGGTRPPARRTEEDRP